MATPGSRQVVLVLGATGQQGGAVAKALTANATSVRAMVRDPGSAAALGLAARGVEIVRGDLADAQAVRRAMAGADGVFSVRPNSGNPNSGITDADEVRLGKLIADLAVESGVQHLVYSSAAIISRGPTGVANLDCKREIEDHIRSLPIPATIVRPATFMELLANPGFWQDRHVISFFASPDQPVELIAVDDIGRITASILGNPDRYAGQVLNIAGDELTGAAMATAISNAIGRHITYRRFSEALLKNQPMLQQTVKSFDGGRASGNADIASLTRQFGELVRFDGWLAGNKKAMRSASGANHAA